MKKQKTSFDQQSGILT